MEHHQPEYTQHRALIWNITFQPPLSEVRLCSARGEMSLVCHKMDLESGSHHPAYCFSATATDRAD